MTNREYRKIHGSDYRRIVNDRHNMNVRHNMDLVDRSIMDVINANGIKIAYTKDSWKSWLVYIIHLTHGNDLVVFHFRPSLAISFEDRRLWHSFHDLMFYTKKFKDDCAFQHLPDVEI